MPRSDRLFRLLHLFRTLPPPVSAAQLAAESGVSLRTIYRDIDALRAGGALIDGAAGYGYHLTEDPALPPQMFSRLEVEALMLGLANLRSTGDDAIISAAASAGAKIIATLPERVQRQALHSAQMIHHFDTPDPAPACMDDLRQAVWDEVALDIRYSSLAGVQTERRIYPLSLVFLDRKIVLLAYCCLRRDFRQFFPASILQLARSDESFRPQRVTLLRDYIALMGQRQAASDG